MDLIGKVYPPSSKIHTFIIVATDYFTKWVEAKAYRNMDHSEVVKFIKETIIYRFGMPKSITANMGTIFINQYMREFAHDYGIQLHHSTPYYAQANEQAEASNKIIKDINSKTVDRNPRSWHELLPQVLWAYNTLYRTSASVSPYTLTYGHDAVLPMEIVMLSLRTAFQANLALEELTEAMMMELEDMDEVRLMSLDKLQDHKQKVAQAYNKILKLKIFSQGNLLWKAILLVGQKDHAFGKCSTTWEGTFKPKKVLHGGAYVLENLDQTRLEKIINGRYLKNIIPQCRRPQLKNKKMR